MQEMCSKEERLKLTQRAKELRDKLTLKEKIELMSSNHTFRDMEQYISDSIREEHFRQAGYYCQEVFYAGGMAEKNIPSMRLCDGSRGVWGKKHTTCFPATICRGASFDKDLEKEIGKAIGEEVRAMGGNLFAGICINLPYHPGWGRSQETYGEDSWQIGEMAGALVEGIQEKNVIACIKHFAFNSMEYSRFDVNIVCDKRTEREVFLPHFKKCIEHGAAAVMSAYNSYQNIRCGHNDYLLNQVLKSEWDFDGFVVSDFILGIRDTCKAANGGMDIELCIKDLFGKPLLQAVKDGRVAGARIDDSTLRIIRTLIAFEESDLKNPAKRKLECKEHIALALQAAREGITLIKNENVLPLDKNKIKRIVVLGRLGQKENVGIHGTSLMNTSYILTPLQGIINHAKNVEVIYYNGRNLEHSRNLARGADAVIFVVGYDEEDEGEYICQSKFEDKEFDEKNAIGDRTTSLNLHSDEIELLNAVGPVNNNSAAVLFGGSMIMIEEWIHSVGAILMAYYPGMEGATAIAEIIFGDVNPSGKLPFVIPYDEKDLPIVKWKTDQQVYDYYHGYAKLDKEQKEASVAFGSGLSYTTFELRKVRFKAEENRIYASCEIENVGNHDGAEVVQMYIGFSNSKIDRPVKVLRGFKRVFLRKKEVQTVVLECSVDDMKWYNPQTDKMELEHMEYEVFIGTSSCKKDLLQGKVTL